MSGDRRRVEDPERIAEGLQELLDKAEMGRTDRATVQRLKALFQGSAWQPLLMVLRVVWSGKTDETLQSNWRGLKRRLNQRLEALDSRLRIEGDSSGDLLYFELSWTEEDEQRRLQEELLPTQQTDMPDTPERLFVPPRVQAQDIPVLTCSEAIGAAAAELAPGFWASLAARPRIPSRGIDKFAHL